MSPFDQVFGVCRLLSLFSWRVSPYNFVFMACVAFNLVLMACVAVWPSFWRVSPSKFVFMACVAFEVWFSRRVSPYNFVFMACVAFNLVLLACVAV